jgi:hypothetical protein
MAASPEKTPSPAPSERPAEKGADRTPSISDRTRDLTRRDGFLPFYWDARKGQLLLEISRWNEDFLYGAGIAGGAGVTEIFLDRGQLGELGLCRFERVGPRALLHQRQMVHRTAVPSGETARVAEESFPSAVLASLPIVAEDGDRVLADATAFLLADAAILPVLKEAKVGDWKQDAARSAFAMERTGAFPKNTEIEAIETFTSENPARAFAGLLPDGHTMSLRIHHTFLKLPEPGFVPRPLDPRIGFIPRRHFDHSARWNEPIEKYLASRWRLIKKDPSAALSEPVEPIVYYLDRGIPEPERSAVRKGALWWNHAFEQAGFKDAFVLKDLPEGATFLDARYSGIEWINRAERGWSVGGGQTDPRTGELLHGVARIDSHRRRTTSRMWRNMTPPGPAGCDAGDSPDFSEVLGPGDGGIDEESLVLDRLAYLSAHEVGHTLGLMHNWAATTFGWGSVMDYLAPNIQLKASAGGSGDRKAPREEQFDLSDAYPHDIGSYDRLAIQWGYSAGGDPAALDRIVRDGYAKGIFYPTDDDPRWEEYDWGADPVAWLATTQRVRRALLERFGAGQLAPGEWVYTLQERFSLAYLYHRFGIQTAQRYVGGQYQANAVAGDGQAPVAWVPAAKQREALDLLVAAISPDNLDIPDRILAVLAAPPSGTRASREQFPSEAGDSFSLWTAARTLVSLVVDPLLEADRAARLTLPASRDALTLDALLARLVSATWDAPADASPRKGALRRIAQRGVLDGLMDLAARPQASAEVRAAVHARLERLKGQLRGKHSTDPAAEAHLRLAEGDLTEFLEKPEVRKARPARPAAPPGRPIGE